MSDAAPSGWSAQPLGELAQIVSGGTPARTVADFWDGGTIAWATPTDITGTQGKYISETAEMITERGLRSCSATLLPVGAILMTSRATLGEAKISKMLACTNQGFKSLIAGQGVSNEFLYYQIQRTKNQYARFGSGSTFLEVGKKDTAAFPILIPEKPLQDSIVDVLDLIDTQIEATEALIAKQERLRTGLMQDLFTRGVDENGELRPPREEAPHLYHETELGWLPREWDTKAAGELLQSIEQGWSPDCASEPADLDEWGVLKTSSILWSGFDRSENKRLPASLLPRPALRVALGDVLMTRAGPNSRVGVVAQVRSEPGNLMISDKIYRLVPKPSIDRSFLAMALSSDVTQTYLSRFKTGLAESQTNISQAIVRRLSIGLPSDNEQRCMVAALNSVESELGKRIQSLHKLKLQKTGLMQDLLTGTVSVEPLLEREPA